MTELHRRLKIMFFFLASSSAIPYGQVMALILTEFQNSVFVHMEQTHKVGETFDPDAS